MHLTLEIREQFSDQEWDNLVETLESNPFQHSAYIHFRCQLEPGTPAYLIARDEKSEIIAALVAYISTPHWWPLSKICKTLTMDTYPCVRQDTEGVTQQFLLTLQKTASRWGIACLRLHSFCSYKSTYRPVKNEGYETKERIEFEIPLNCDEKDILGQIDRKWRQKIHRAERIGLCMYEFPSNHDWEQLLSLHENSIIRKKNRGGQISIEYIENLSCAIGNLIKTGLARAFGAYREDELLSFVIVLIDGKQAVGAYAGSSGEGYKVAASGFLFWSVAVELNRDGLHVFNIGGVPVEAEAPDHVDHGLYRFKKGLASQKKHCVSGIQFINSWPAKFLQFRQQRGNSKSFRPGNFKVETGITSG